MAIRVALHHKTDYLYDRMVELSPQVVRLRPAPHCRTPITAYSLKIEPREHFINWQQDPQSNYLARIVFPKPVHHFSVEVDLVAEISVINPFDFFLEHEDWPFQYADDLRKELTPFLFVEPPGPKLRAYLKEIDRTPKRCVDFLVALNQQLQHAIGYVIRLEPGIQSCEETLTLRKGSCRDTAWLLVEILRNIGLAARFVSGYLIQLKPDVKPLDGPVGPSQDFTDLHAWAEVYLPGAGWIGLDPTSGLFAGEGHIPLATAPEASSAAPVTGLVGPCEVEFHHEMSITRIHEDPRVTLPYTDEQWNRIETLGFQIDRDISAGDIRLTMGGEPTFVSIDDMEGAEWNIAALGKEKRKLSEQLLWRMYDRFAPGGLMHYGQGKWYPGEQLPRWALSCYWRKDGVPMWRDEGLFARDDSKTNFGPVEAQLFSETLASRLGIDAGYVNAAFEDPVYYLQRERQLPINVDPIDNRLEDPVERERIRKVFERGLETPTGYVLPLQRGIGKDGPQWQTGLWMLRGQHVFLMPGDSALGLRLPLNSLPWVAASEAPQIFPVDPTGKLPPLPEPQHISPAEPKLQSRRLGDVRDKKPKVGQSAPWIVRTALCVEPREGKLHVFMPPLASTEDYIELLTAIEDTAAHLKLPLIIEGYTPPADYRINKFSVTPDPGVIEVNIHPAHNWSELVRSDHRTLRRRAPVAASAPRNSWLTDAIPGPAAAIISRWAPRRRPTVHFCAVPIFCAACSAIGSTIPRFRISSRGCSSDRPARRRASMKAAIDNLYELEIAFSQIPNPGGAYCPPWLVDRIFRHILVDLTGNTHRAEFCIDKLYSPDSATGRLGLARDARLRDAAACADEPHAAVAGARAGGVVLARALSCARRLNGARSFTIASCCRTYVSADFRDVLDDLRRAGYPFEHDWFAPHFEFRYPVYGRVNYDGIDIELRQAIEPWYVLGEEPAGGATARLCRFLGGAAAGQGQRHDQRSLCDRLQWAAGAAEIYRRARRMDCGRPLSRMAAAVVPASDDSRPYAAGLRPLRYLDRTLHRRMHLSCLASRRS